LFYKPKIGQNRAKFKAAVANNTNLLHQVIAANVGADLVDVF